MNKKPTLGLALGGGAARGFAHIGVLKVLQEAEIQVDYLAGTSMGSLVGAFYASGMDIKMLERLVSAAGRRTWVDITVSKMGLISGEKVKQMIYLLTRRKTFAELKIPLAVVAADLYSGEKVVFTEGLVCEAVRASISIPGYFVPVEKDNLMLVDGAILDRVPAGVARNMGAEFVIAVDPGHFVQEGKINTMLDVITRSIDVMSKAITHYHMEEADVIISPDLSGIAPSHFEKAKEAIARGEQAAWKALPEIQAKLERRDVIA